MGGCQATWPHVCYMLLISHWTDCRPEFLKRAVVQSCNCANFFRVCAKSWDLYTQTRKVMHYYNFSYFLHFFVTCRVFFAHFLALNCQRVNLDCTRKSAFRRSAVDWTVTVRVGRQLYFLLILISVQQSLSGYVKVQNTSLGVFFLKMLKISFSKKIAWSLTLSSFCFVCITFFLYEEAKSVTYFYSPIGMFVFFLAFQVPSL